MFDLVTIGDSLVDIFFVLDEHTRGCTVDKSKKKICFDYAEKMSPLGNASSDDCANYCVMMFSDMTRMVTMQNLFHDGGFSFTGVTEAVINKMEK